MSPWCRYASLATQRVSLVVAVGTLGIAACSTSESPGSAPEATSDSAVDSASEATSESAPDSAPESTPDSEPSTEPYRYPAPPAVPSQDNPVADEAIDRIVAFVGTATLDTGAVSDLAESGDARHAWFISDLLRFFQGADSELLVESFETMTGVSIAGDPELLRSPWSSVTNHLIAWDTPDYVGYRDDKADIFTQVEPKWEPFFADVDAEIDWRLLSWGGVFIDDRPLGATEICAGGCIPALDDPATTDAAAGDWYPDERVVFGVVVNGEALAIPLNIAEIHEMFNLTLGGRRLAIPYCTLCGSAQAYFTDQADGTPTPGASEVPVVRTSGLLSRSNKVMFDLLTYSVFDTFTGAAVSGPLHDQGVVLEETTVVRSSWGEWKQDHPDTQIIAEDGGIGRRYEPDPLRGRDDNGPIFPIGDVDPRLGVQDLVVGVIGPDGTTFAFPAEQASATLAAGDTVELNGVELRESGDGLVAADAATGEALVAHEAFWFAWSQFHPDTQLWTSG